ncbi:hypothetical protein BDZ89DRAFT_1144319 [Hymenopellis radicata]|nr:hypothetical protein BDZ89DRAFT_1144319 [Hymenopellis radicata]
MLTRVSNYTLLFKTYQDNYTEFAGKDSFDSLTSKEQKYRIDLEGELIKAAVARDKAHKAGEWVAHVSFELPRPDRSLEPGGKPPLCAVPREKRSTKRPKPYDRKKPTPVVHARAAPRAPQSQAQHPVIPPPPATVFMPPQPQNELGFPGQCQPPTAFSQVAMTPRMYRAPPTVPFSANPQPVVVPMEYYQYNDLTCSIPEGRLPGSRSDTLLRRWIEYQKAEEEDVCAMKRLEEDARVVKAGEAKAVDWSLPP